ncbi:MAG: GNAT family N-acetyltransferase [Actinomycetota bacterium]|nr:GNAT family N-acetyltransferase [Actinomycetota bacterium]
MEPQDDSTGLTELRTPRLLMRAWREEDKKPFAAMNADPQVMQYFPEVLQEPESDALVERLRDQHAQYGYTVWALQVLESEHGSADFVGFTGLSHPSFDLPFEHSEPCVEVGWRLSPPWWGMGLASEAARAAITYGFDVLCLEEIVSFTTPSNEASWRVMERIGMHRAEEFDHPRAQAWDWWQRHLLYRMSPNDPRP